MDLDQSHPALCDLAARARRRLPHFVWEYLDSGTGNDEGHHRTVAALDAVTLVPRVLDPPANTDLSVELMGRSHPLPVGIAPIGMSGLIWPGAEAVLARVAARLGIPYTLSTVAAATPETVGPHTGDQGWFQLYPPGDADIRRDLLKRARDAGFHTLVLTADVPIASRRERQRRARLTNPMRMSLPVIAQAAMAPAWALATLRAGIPRLVTLESYANIETHRPGTAHIGYMLRTPPDWTYLAALREEWDGKLVVKGVLNAEDARRIMEAGADAIWVSAHGGRQFEAAPAPLDALVEIRAVLGPEAPLIYDGGIRSGTDVLRAIAMGADFVMLGRAWHHGLAAFGEAGVSHVAHILSEGLKADMGQLGIGTPTDVRGRLPQPTMAPRSPST